jgi:hypothetical protein
MTIIREEMWNKYTERVKMWTKWQIEGENICK